MTTMTSAIDRLAAAVAAYPPGPDLPPDHPATRELREIGEQLPAAGGIDAMRDALIKADPGRTGDVARRVNRIWTGIAGWYG